MSNTSLIVAVGQEASGPVALSTLTPFNDSMLSLNATVVTSNATTIDLVIKVVLYCLGISAILLNIGFLFAMFRTKNCNTKDSAFAYQCFVKGLSFADILATMSFLIAMNANSPMTHIYPESDSFFLRSGVPYIIRGFPWLFFTAYFLMLTCLSVNQYVAVCLPLQYDVMAQPRKIVTCLITVCVISSCQVLVPIVVSLALHSLNDVTYAEHKLRQISKIEMEVWMCVFIISTVLNIGLNVLMYVKLRELKWKRRQSAGVAETLNIRIMHEAFVTICLLLLITILLRLPFPITSIVSIEMGYARIDWSIFQVVNRIVVVLLFTNFFADPIIYISRMREARAFMQTTSTNCVHGCRRHQAADDVGGVEMTTLMHGQRSERNGNSVKNLVEDVAFNGNKHDLTETTCTTDVLS